MTGLVPLVKKILIGTGIIEGIEQFFMRPQYVPEFGIGYGIWAAIFNSISAFCKCRNGYCKRRQSAKLCNESSYEFYDNGADHPGRSWICCMERSLAGIQKIVKDKSSCKRMIQQWRFQTKIVLSITSF